MARLQDRHAGDGRTSKYEKLDNKKAPIGDTVYNHEGFGAGKAVNEEEQELWNEQEKVGSKAAKKKQDEEDVQGEMKVRGSAKDRAPQKRSPGKQWSEGNEEKQSPRLKTSRSKEESLAGPRKKTAKK